MKSLLAVGHRLGYLPFDVGRAMKLPARKDQLAERIVGGMGLRLSAKVWTSPSVMLSRGLAPAHHRLRAVPCPDATAFRSGKE